MTEPFLIWKLVFLLQKMLISQEQLCLINRISWSSFHVSVEKERYHSGSEAAEKTCNSAMQKLSSSLKMVFAI